jgi:peptidoglycan/LPS O-acetylase OafA/YrhL
MKTPSGNRDRRMAWQAIVSFRECAELGKGEMVVLDVVRSLAAFVVFMSHWDSGAVIPTHERQTFLEGLGFPSVLVFFVLSGYVISSTSQSREATPRDYFVARIARLYSVAIPTLILLAFVEHAFALAVPTVPSFATASGWIQLLVSLVFANDWWFSDIVPFSDAPYWSLSFEAAYYTLWGFFLFGGKFRWLLLALGALVVGPRIMLLAPLWLAGAALYRSRIQLTRLGAYMVLPLAVALVALGRSRFVLPESVFGMSGAFPGHWIRAAGVCLGLASLLALRPFGESNRPIKWFAGRSFTLYLLHYPILRILSTYMFDWRAHILGRLVIGLVTLATCLGFGDIVEPTKARWKRWIDNVWGRIFGPKMRSHE